jgi:hypothetical protein
MSSGRFPGAVGTALARQLVGEPAAPEPPAQRHVAAGAAHEDVVALSLEGNLVAGLDAELVAQSFGDHDLALGPDPVSHTAEYNPIRDVRSA